jgi:hypothetical protein
MKRNKMADRISKSFLFKKRWCSQSIGDVLNILVMGAVCIYMYRHLSVGF